MLLELVDTLAAARFGSDAMFSPMERSLVEPSLARIIERYGSVAQQFAFLADPILVGVGLVLYGNRLAGVVREQAAAKKPPQPAVEQTQPMADEVVWSEPVATVSSRPIEVQELFAAMPGPAF